MNQIIQLLLKALMNQHLNPFIHLAVKAANKRVVVTSTALIRFFSLLSCNRGSLRILAIIGEIIYVVLVIRANITDTILTRKQNPDRHFHSEVKPKTV